MKSSLVRFPLIFLGALLVMASAAQAQQKPQTPATQSRPDAQQSAKRVETRGDAAADIKRMLTEQTAAWNRGDLEGFMKGYWNSPELTFYSGGTIAQGWQAAMDRYKKNYQGTGKEMGKLEFQDLDVDVVSSDAAVVLGKWQLTKSDGTKPHGLFTLILKKMQGGWQIVHDHTSANAE